MNITTMLEEYNALVKECQHTMARKNADYGSSWEDMRSTSITDQILVKIQRIRHLEGLESKGEAPQVSEGIDSEIRDCLNYLVLLHLKRQIEGDANR